MAKCDRIDGNSGGWASHPPTGKSHSGGLTDDCISCQTPALQQASLDMEGTCRGVVLRSGMGPPSADARAGTGGHGQARHGFGMAAVTGSLAPRRRASTRHPCRRRVADSESGAVGSNRRGLPTQRKGAGEGGRGSQSAERACSPRREKEAGEASLAEALSSGPARLEGGAVLRSDQQVTEAGPQMCQTALSVLSGSGLTTDTFVSHTNRSLSNAQHQIQLPCACVKPPRR